MSLIRINPQFNLFFPVSVLRCLGGCAQWGRSSLRCAPPVLLSLEKPGAVLQQQCQSRSSLWAEPAVSVSPGRAGEECSTWEQVLLSPLAHTDTCQTGVTQKLLSRYHPNLAWFHSSSSSCCGCLHCLEFSDQSAGTSSRFCSFLHLFCFSHPSTWLFYCTLRLAEPLGFVFCRRGGWRRKALR